MPGSRRVTAEIVIDGAGISGTITEAAGEQQTFNGWLQLISILQSDSQLEDGQAENPPMNAQGKPRCDG